MEVSQRMAVVLSGLRRWPDGEPHGGLRLWPLSCLCPPSPASDCLTPKALPLHKTYIHRKERPGAPLRDPSNRLTSLLGIRARSLLLGGVTPTSQAEFLQLLPASLFFMLVWGGWESWDNGIIGPSHTAGCKLSSYVSWGDTTAPISQSSVSGDVALLLEAISHAWQLLALFPPCQSIRSLWPSRHN